MRLKNLNGERPLTLKQASFSWGCGCAAGEGGFAADPCMLLMLVLDDETLINHTPFGKQLLRILEPVLHHHSLPLSSSSSSSSLEVEVEKAMTTRQLLIQETRDYLLSSSSMPISSSSSCKVDDKKNYWEFLGRQRNAIVQDVFHNKKGSKKAVMDAFKTRAENRLSCCASVLQMVNLDSSKKC